MEQYIPKAALLAEIECLRKNQRLDDRHGQGVLDGLRAIERFLDTLEVKEVDLEKELSKVWKDWANEYAISFVSYKEIAKHFFEYGLKAQKGE